MNNTQRASAQMYYLDFTHPKDNKKTHLIDDRHFLDHDIKRDGPQRVVCKKCKRRFLRLVDEKGQTIGYENLSSSVDEINMPISCALYVMEKVHH